ncbi:hypothetical protein O9H85_15190 [Paenibacillus filicis]|uniref:Uncharacterized protein n=1 Tax=Paenibacillus gyeongsangnamensis TaxID=3388067 RepID=A0ABT4QA49_9BACL|nr:hypothetical protein [Paenibacillus filicis]MCZ8513752.1 hypothetical protein [Paenibacillus filicis]
MKEYAASGDTGPYGIAKGIDLDLWFAEQKANRIGRIAVSGEIVSYGIPTPGSSDSMQKAREFAPWLLVWY